jgi:phosphoglycerate dehydrogenase-like enzyme
MDGVRLPGRLPRARGPRLRCLRQSPEAGICSLASMKIVAIAPPDFPALERLRSMPEVELVAAKEAEALRGRFEGVEVVVLAPLYGAVLSELWLELKDVRWIQSLSAGVETLPFDLLRRSPIVLTNSRGLYADALGEWAIAAMLWFTKDLRRLARSQEARRWDPFFVERLEGKSAGIIGLGGIGRAVARRAEAMGVRVTAVSRRRESGDPTVDEVIRESDFVVLATPLTPSTRGLMSRERLESMRSSAVLINLSRGAVVDQAALVDLLRERRIRGAALDVFEVEPLPADDPLWSLDNVLLSPHSADHTSDAHDRVMTFFLENLARYRRGEPLENVVDKVEQY